MMRNRITQLSQPYIPLKLPNSSPLSTLPPKKNTYIQSLSPRSGKTYDDT